MKTLAEVQEMARTNAEVAVDQFHAGVYRDAISAHARNVIDTVSEWRADLMEGAALEAFYFRIAELLSRGQPWARVR